MESSEVTLSIGDASKELVTDMIELITVFSARLYGSRSRKNKKLVDGMTQAVKDAR